MGNGIIIRATTSVIALLVALIMTFFGWFRSTINKVFKYEEDTTSSYTETTTESESTTEATTESSSSTTQRTTKSTTSRPIVTVTTTDPRTKYINEVRKTSFGGTHLESIEDCTVGSDGAYYCCGTVRSTDGDFADINLSSYGSPSGFIVRVNRNGSIGWVKVKGDANYKYYFTCCAGLSNGNIVAAGYRVKNNLSSGEELVYQAFLTIYDKNGSVVKSKYFASLSNAFINCVAATADGFVIGGATKSHEMDFAFVPSDYSQDYAFLMTLDNDGKIISSKAFGGTKGAAINDVDADSSGNIFAGLLTVSTDGDFASFTELKGHRDSNTVIYKLDSALNVKWGRAFAEKVEVDLCHIAASSDGGCVVAGNVAEISGVPTGFMTDLSVYAGTNAVILKLSSSNGSTEWHYSIRGTGEKIIEDICVAAGNYAVVGSSTTDNGDFHTNYGDKDGFTALLSSAGKMLAVMENGGSDIDKTTAAVYANGYLKVFGNSMSKDEFFSGLNQYVAQADPDDEFPIKYDCFTAKYKITIS